jgi:hypothetical protein
MTRANTACHWLPRAKPRIREEVLNKAIPL